ncbi:hypothetical protein EPUL_004942 [Erysiphe pulchra]|uniref:ATP-dependent DNA helicase n=1 Tax=Erysiphe pulchra TaxID=225359 RepID=A0A2S4PKE5_9PEZI|nr:hypothetical protein EPUL_004942 [Erysiphe pulchra]
MTSSSQSHAFIDWMKYNAANADGRDLLYSEFPGYYTYNKKRGWQKRKKGMSIGRMPIAVPRQVNGVYHQGPSVTCQALGLTFDDSEWFLLFNEIKDTSSAPALRRTFAAALHLSALDRFKSSFTDDHLWRIRYLGERIISPPINWTEEKCRYDNGLWLLEENLRDLGLDWDTARLIGLEHNWVVRESNPLLVEALDFDPAIEATKHSSALSSLSPGQRAAYDTIVNATDGSHQPNVIYLQGAAGTGKIVLCVASSGIAAVLLPNDRTAHSQFRIPLECKENDYCSIDGTSNLAKLLEQTSFIIWEEVIMQLKHHFSAVDRSL